ncbi:MAG: ABC transporter ATP-binding protein [Verrucomicrobiota bacterium]
MNTQPAIEISGLEKRYPKFTLGPLNLSVPKGSIYGLIGPNGAGKTTLIDLIFGMGAPHAGTIKVCGFDHTTDEVALKNHAGYFGPDLSYVVWGDVGRAIRFVKGFRPTWDDAYCQHLLETLGIATSEKIATLSFGGRTKLGLLLALAWKPQVLILDEPTTGLDAHSKQAVFSELLAIVRDEERTVLISSHQLSDLERFTDHVGILHKGRLLAEGATAELVERHMQVEFTCERTVLENVPGLTIAEHNENRCRAILDTDLCSLEILEQHGACEVRSQPLTLEELFLVLTK